jgi:glyoxylase-like metal-dependent hydrolase (beta-lactamase superfamily II)
VLFDTGYEVGDRREANLCSHPTGWIKQIDYVVISHWHADHVGGRRAHQNDLIGQFFDHGDAVQPRTGQGWRVTKLSPAASGRS